MITQSDIEKSLDMFSGYPDVVDVDTMCAMLGGISKKLGYKLLASNQIPNRKVGRTYRIAKVHIISFFLGNIAPDRWTFQVDCGSVSAVNGRQIKPYCS